MLRLMRNPEGTARRLLIAEGFLQTLVDAGGTEGMAIVATQRGSVMKELVEKLKDVRVDELNLSVRSRHSLQKLGIKHDGSIDQLLSISANQLLELPSCSDTHVQEIRDALALHGKRLQGDG